MGEDSISRQGMEQPVLRMGWRSDLLQRSSKQHMAFPFQVNSLRFLWTVVDAPRNTRFAMLFNQYDEARAPLKWGLSKGSLADRPKSPVLGRFDQAGPLSFERPAEGLAPSASSLPVPGYGREPVGNGHAAAGFSALLAPEVAAVDGGAA